MVLLLLLGLGAACASADEKPAGKQPARRPSTVAQVVEAVVRATEGKDQAALEALAKPDAPDPWLVVDELCRRGRHAAAEAFAKAAPRPVVAGLPGYIATQRDRPSDSDERAQLDAVLRAAGAGKWIDVLTAAEKVPRKLDSIVRLRCAFARGVAFGASRRKRESSAALLEVGRAAAKLGWYGIASAALDSAARDAYRISDWPGALTAWELRLDVLRSLGDTKGLAQTLGNLGNVHLQRSEYAEARTRYAASLEIKRKLDDRSGIARTLGSLGVLERRLGNYPQALAHYDEALAFARKRNDRLSIAQMLGNIGNVHLLRGDYPLALTRHQESLRTFTDLKHRGSMALALKSIGDVHFALGDYEASLVHREGALKLFVDLGDRQHAARVKGSLGSTHMALGNYPVALARYEEALSMARDLGDSTAEAAWLASLGAMQGQLGNHAKALARYEQSLALARKLGERSSIALALVNIGGAQSSLGLYEKARERYVEALALRRALGDKAGVASVLLNIGITHANQGEHALALARHEEALAAYRAIDAKSGMVRSLRGIGFARRQRGNLDGAALAYEEALGFLAEAGNPADRCLTLGGLAEVRVAQGRNPEALAHARDGVEIATGLAEGLAEGEGAGALDSFLPLFDAGMRAALAAQDVEALLWMLEHARATTLREMLGSRQALQAAVVPPKLGQALTLARLKEARTRAAAVKARRGRSLKNARSARQAYERAQSEVLAAVTRIQRDAKSAASLVLPAPDDVATLKAHLRPGEALVYYGLTTSTAFAVIVEPEGARSVALGTSRDVRAAVDALLLEESPYIEPGALAALSARIVAPLDLPARVQRVLISPTGRLGYVPIGMLFPKHDVLFVPSGTALGLLLEEREKHGTQILAVGDPDYRLVGRGKALAQRAGAPLALVPLPGTRAEAKAIADVTLLGRRATPGRLEEALREQARWRAVHLACHGWVDPDRPLLSGLALTATAKDDGLLTCLDVFRMQIPADLVVLSACETGKGKVYATEGIVGLTRAFMFAGAPRVVCSLWKVDDEATREFMIRFYAAWNKKDGSRRGAAAALREAQTHVRTFERIVVDAEASRAAGRTVTRKLRPWEHPNYWAAWVLWGLPD